MNTKYRWLIVWYSPVKDSNLWYFYAGDGQWSRRIDESRRFRTKQEALECKKHRAKVHRDRAARQSVVERMRTAL